MAERIYNFYSGPAMLPARVLEQAQEGMLDFQGTGMSVMELSHRSATFLEVLRSAERRLRSLLEVAEHYRIFFLQGGASLQFSMVPMNFLNGGTADYLITGTWSKKAMQRASEFGAVRAIDYGEDGRYAKVPTQDELSFSANPRYVHYVSNETIDGVEFSYDVDASGIPVVCDASSNILSRPINVEEYALIYAGAQKNIGPSGVTVVIVREDFLAEAHGPAGVLNYRSFTESDSMPNTPNTWGVYMIDLVCGWLQDTGGLEAARVRNLQKAEMLYSAIDGSDGFYTGTAETASRSKMNVTFRLPSAELEGEFCDTAAEKGLVGLRGHRSVGGVRASIYNAFPLEGIERLAEHMREFAERKG